MRRSFFVLWPFFPSMPTFVPSISQLEQIFHLGKTHLPNLSVGVIHSENDILDPLGRRQLYVASDFHPNNPTEFHRSGGAHMSELTQIVLSEHDMPTHWYNINADLPAAGVELPPCSIPAPSSRSDRTTLRRYFPWR